MAYRLEAGEGPGEGLTRCAREQLEDAIAQLGRVDAQPVAAVHEARKSLKKARSALRLGRGVLPAKVRRRENAALRDAGRRLAGDRDAAVVVAAVDDLAARYAGQLPATVFAQAHERLAAGRPAARAAAPIEAGAVAEQIAAVAGRLEELDPKRGGWSALAPGLKEAYGEGRRRRAQALKDPTTEALHEWRKRVKDLWYHGRLLEGAWPEGLAAPAEEAHRLSERLGEDHDLAVLRARLVVADVGSDPLPVDLQPLIAMLDHRRRQLQDEAMRLGERLYTEKPGRFERRMKAYWKAWEHEQRDAARRDPAELAEAASA